MNKIFISKSESETENFALSLAKTLKKGSVIALHGNLGAGKTVFTRGFARGLGITEPVSSPTFTIVQEYELKNNNWLFHLDLYRIDDYRAALAFGIEEFLEDPNAFTLIEWPERINEIMPENVIHITISHLNENEREIVIK